MGACGATEGVPAKVSAQCSPQPGSSARTHKCDLWSQQLEAAMLASSKQQQGQVKCDLCLVEGGASPGAQATRGKFKRQAESLSPTVLRTSLTACSDISPQPQGLLWPWVCILTPDTPTFSLGEWIGGSTLPGRSRSSMGRETLQAALGKLLSF